MNSTAPLGEISGRLVVGHFNHGLRGEDSDQDETFVRELADELKIECCVGIARSDTADVSEAVLREQRYKFLESVAHEHQARYLALGHHAEDQRETILFRLFRGSGVAGLSGMRTFRPAGVGLTIARPLLHVEPRLIRAALAEWDQSFREDATNEQSDYARNFIRNDVLPLIRSRFGDTVDAGILRLGQQAESQQIFLRKLSEPLMACVNDDDSQVTINCEEIVGVEPILIAQLIAEIWQHQGWPRDDFGERDFQRLTATILNPTGEREKYQLPGGVTVVRDGTTVTLLS